LFSTSEEVEVDAFSQPVFGMVPVFRMVHDVLLPRYLLPHDSFDHC
jgi:hypothetical protein